MTRKWIDRDTVVQWLRIAAGWYRVPPVEEISQWVDLQPGTTVVADTTADVEASARATTTPTSPAGTGPFGFTKEQRAKAMGVSVPYGWHRNGDSYDTDFRAMRAAAVQPELRLRALELACSCAGRVGDAPQAMAEAFYQWLTAAPTAGPSDAVIRAEQMYRDVVDAPKVKS